MYLYFRAPAGGTAAAAVYPRQNVTPDYFFFFFLDLPFAVKSLVCHGSDVQWWLLYLVDSWPIVHIYMSITRELTNINRQLLYIRVPGVNTLRTREYPRYKSSELQTAVVTGIAGENNPLLYLLHWDFRIPISMYVLDIIHNIYCCKYSTHNYILLYQAGFESVGYRIRGTHQPGVVPT